MVLTGLVIYVTVKNNTMGTICLYSILWELTSRQFPPPNKQPLLPPTNKNAAMKLTATLMRTTIFMVASPD